MFHQFDYKVKPSFKHKTTRIENPYADMDFFVFFVFFFGDMLIHFLAENY